MIPPSTEEQFLKVGSAKGQGQDNWLQGWSGRDRSQTQPCAVWRGSSQLRAWATGAKPRPCPQDWSWWLSSNGQRSRCTRPFTFLPIVALSAGMKEIKLFPLLLVLSDSCSSLHRD